jgi:hypothetical protein
VLLPFVVGSDQVNEQLVGGSVCCGQVSEVFGFIQW